MFRYTIVALSAVTLLGTTVFIIWVLGHIVSALNALVFPLAIAGVLALILYPIVDMFEHFLRMNRLAAVISLFLVLFGLFVMAMVLVLPTAVGQGREFFESVPEMFARGHEILSFRFPTTLPMLEEFLSGIKIQSMLPDADKATSKAMGYIGFLMGLAFIPLYLFFALLSGNRLKGSAKSMLFLFTYKQQEEVMYLSQLFVDYVTAFFRGQLIIGLIMGVLMAVGFTFIGLEAAIYFGLALGLLNIVPYLGFIVGVVTVVPIAYFQPDGGGQLVMLLLTVITATQLVESVWLTPKIMADRSGLHPALVVVSILFWGTVLGGVIGMILAVPLTAFLVTVGAHVKNRMRITIRPDEIDR